MRIIKTANSQPKPGEGRALFDASASADDDESTKHACTFLFPPPTTAYVLLATLKYVTAHTFTPSSFESLHSQDGALSQIVPHTPQQHSRSKGGKPSTAGEQVVPRFGRLFPRLAAKIAASVSRAIPLARLAGKQFGWDSRNLQNYSPTAPRREGAGLHSSERGCAKI